MLSYYPIKVRLEVNGTVVPDHAIVRVCSAIGAVERAERNLIRLVSRFDDDYEPPI